MIDFKFWIGEKYSYPQKLFNETGIYYSNADLLLLFG